LGDRLARSFARPLILFCCFVLAGACDVHGQTSPNSQSVASTSLEVAWNESLQPLSTDSWSNDAIAPTFSSSLSPALSPTIQPRVPDMPNPLTSDGYVPLTAQGRWYNFWNDTLLSPLAYVGAIGGAYGQQISDQPRQWGSGFAGYTKRVGTNLAQFGSQEAIHQGGAALMHTDPRYINCRCKGGFQRTLYALKMSFLTYKDNGDKTVDIPQLAGAYGGVIISDVPYPSRDLAHESPLLQGVRGGNIQIGANVAINLFKEFSPELSRLNPFRRHTDAK
jgi:hypothetical protein